MSVGDNESAGHNHLRSLRRFSVDGDNAAALEGMDMAKDCPVSNLYWIRALCWTISSATSIFTSKRLIVSHNYPATIAFRVYGAIIVLYTYALFLGSEPDSQDRRSTIWRMRRPRWKELLPNQRWRGMIPASIAAAISIPSLFQALLHMPSLHVLVMLFPFIHAVELSALFMHHYCRPQQQPFHRTTPPLHTIFTTLASAMILYNEYRLLVPGLVWSVTSLTSIGAARALFAIECSKIGGYGTQVALQTSHSFFVMALLFGLAFSAVVALTFEQAAGFNVPFSTLQLMLFHLVSLLCVTFTGSSLLVYSPVSLEDAQLSPSAMSSIFGFGFSESFVSSLLVLIATIYSKPSSVVSTIQLVAYAIAAVSLLRFDQIHQLLRPLYGRLSIKRTSKVVSNGLVLLLAAVLVLALSVLVSSSLTSIPAVHFVSLDSQYNSTSSPFDIVVSAYLEKPESIKRMVDAIKSTVFLSTLKPKVILYTKDPNADITALRRSTDVDIVIRLENLGREGGTYLHHIINNWDSIAEKTMFIQAHAHNMRELIPRINHYLVADTGMLSLGFTGMTCRCGDCQDRWGWEDHGSVIPNLYQQIYNQSCDSHTPILLSYKGQFVASAKRIRGISKPIYEKLLRAITSDKGWNEDNEDSGYQGPLDNPFFGYTMERIWGLVMQCSTNERVAARCPSLLSGKGNGDDVQDCQCLDPR